MRKPPVAFAVLTWLVVGVVPASAAVKPNPLFSDHAVLQRDLPVPVWGTADPDEKVTVKIQEQSVSATAGKDGKWMVKLAKLKAGGPFELKIEGTDGGVTLKNVLVGDVWVASGQSNMEWPVRASADPQKAIDESKNDQIRLFTVPKKTSKTPLTTVDAKWVECGPTTVPGFSAVAYFFGRDLQQQLKVPIGLIHTSWGGTICEAWASVPALEKHPDFKSVESIWQQQEEAFKKALAKYQDDVAKAKAAGKTPPKPPNNPEFNPNRPSVLYNAMIAPLIPYGIRGAIWYQGESNAGRAYQYRTLFPLMIQNWRDDWKQGDFAFLLVQLAPFMKIVKDPQESAWAELRESQLMATTRLPKVGIAVITDVGHETDIHPKQKEPVGHRLALGALALSHDQKLVYSGPVYDSMKVEEGKAVLSFKHVGGGLVAKGGALTGFTICGEDHKFYNADAKIEGDKIVVSSSQVAKPVAVRYGWANFPVVNLENKEGLPASPFRTDDFPGVTTPKK
jgi:sialate O-acetylesterase